MIIINDYQHIVVPLDKQLNRELTHAFRACIFCLCLRFCGARECHFNCWRQMIWGEKKNTQVVKMWRLYSQWVKAKWLHHKMYEGKFCITYIETRGRNIESLYSMWSAHCTQKSLHTGHIQVGGRVAICTSPIKLKSFMWILWVLCLLICNFF